MEYKEDRRWDTVELEPLKRILVDFDWNPEELFQK